MTNYVLTSTGGFIGEDELYHYGVPGMKWGVRKDYQNERNAYRQAKKEFKTASKNYIRAGMNAFGIKGISKYKKAQSDYGKAETKMIDAKAKYNAAKSRNSEKAEFNTYRKAMQKSGIRGSDFDEQSSGRSTKIYNHLKVTKGKEYADKVEKKVQDVAISKLVAGTAVALGSAIVAGILESKS